MLDFLMVVLLISLIIFMLLGGVSLVILVLDASDEVKDWLSRWWDEAFNRRAE